MEASLPPPHLGGPDAPTSVGVSALGYDDYGRVVSTGGGAETFGYDLLGRMISITRQSGTSETLYYDPFGALVQRQVGTTVLSYVGRRATVSGTLAAGCQTPACGVVVSSVDFHVTLGSRRVASVRAYPTAATRTLYYYRDRLGSVVATTLGGGASGASYRYSAYGALEVAVGESSDSASEIGYAGALALSGGLLSMGARVYDPALKIWMQPDPLQPFKYDYADGDPINRTDLTGMQSEDVAVPAPDTPAGVLFDELAGYPYRFDEEIVVIGTRPPAPPESLGIVGWGYSTGKSSESRNLRSFGAEFRRAFVRNLTGNEGGAKSAGPAVIAAVHGFDIGENAAAMAGTMTTVEALKGTTYLLRNGGLVSAGNDILLGAIWAEASVALLSVAGGTAFAITYDAAFEAAAEAAYATTYDAVYVVLKRGRY